MTASRGRLTTRRAVGALAGIVIVAGCGPNVAPSMSPAGSLPPSPALTESSSVVEPEPPFPTSPYEPAEFWELASPGGDNVEVYRSLAAMSKAADTVVTGTPGAIRQDPERHPGLDPADGSFATIEFEVEHVLAGRAEYVRPGIVNVELFMTDPRQYRRFAAGLPSGRVMLFLRNKAVEAIDNGWPPEGPDTGHLYYRIVSENGFIRDVAGKAVPSGGQARWLEGIATKTFSQIVAEVQAAAS